MVCWLCLDIVLLDFQIFDDNYASWVSGSSVCLAISYWSDSQSLLELHDHLVCCFWHDNSHREVGMEKSNEALGDIRTKLGIRNLKRVKRCFVKFIESVYFSKWLVLFVSLLWNWATKLWKKDWLIRSIFHLNLSYCLACRSLKWWKMFIFDKRFDIIECSTTPLLIKKDVIRTFCTRKFVISIKFTNKNIDCTFGIKRGIGQV